MDRSCCSQRSSTNEWIIDHNNQSAVKFSSAVIITLFFISIRTHINHHFFSWKLKHKLVVDYEAGIYCGRVRVVTLQ